MFRSSFACLFVLSFLLLGCSSESTAPQSKQVDSIGKDESWDSFSARWKAAEIADRNALIGNSQKITFYFEGKPENELKKVFGKEDELKKPLFDDDGSYELLYYLEVPKDGRKKTLTFRIVEGTVESVGVATSQQG